MVSSTAAMTAADSPPAIASGSTSDLDSTLLEPCRLMIRKTSCLQTEGRPAQACACTCWSPLIESLAAVAQRGGPFPHLAQAAARHAAADEQAWGLCWAQ